MKKQLNTATALALAAIFVISSGFAQLADEASAHTSATSKKVHAARDEYSKNIKVDRDFAKRFINAKSISWKVSGKEYIATFKVHDRLGVAWYAKSGKLYCVNYYGTYKDLPVAEREIIAESYPDYHVTATLEIHKDDITTYVVTIQSCKMQKKVKIINEEIEEMESLDLAR